VKRKIFVLGGYAPSLINFRGPLLCSIVDCGWEVVAAAPSLTVEIRSVLAASGVRAVEVPLHRTGLNPLRDIVTIFTLYRLIWKERPDVFLAYTIKPVILGSLAAGFRGVPTVCSIITGLGYSFLSETKKQRLIGVVAQLLYRTALRWNRLVLFQNSDDLDLFLKMKLLRGPEKAALVNGSGVDLDWFQLSEPVLSPPTFILVARLYAEKGVREYAAAARAIKRRYPMVRFIIVGGPDSNPSAIGEGEVRSWVADGILEWVGVVKDVRPHLKRASVLVLPSYREGMPRSVLEAMAMGKPVVTTYAPGCRSTIEDGISGFLVPVKDAKALEAALERFVLEPVLIESMGLNARRRAEAMFDVNRVNAEVLSYLGIRKSES
jgi:glycosyltransferase involved in cell wall biosynthesis